MVCTSHLVGQLKHHSLHLKKNSLANKRPDSRDISKTNISNNTISVIDKAKNIPIYLILSNTITYVIISHTVFLLNSGDHIIASLPCHALHKGHSIKLVKTACSSPTGRRSHIQNSSKPNLYLMWWWWAAHCFRRVSLFFKKKTIPTTATKITKMKDLVLAVISKNTVQNQ